MLNINNFIQIATYIGMGYLLVRRYRSSLAVIPPPNWQLWLASKPLLYLRKLGIVILISLVITSYLLWRTEEVNKHTINLLFILMGLSVALLSNPEKWFAEAYFYNAKPKLWERLKREAVSELKQNYWKIVLKRAVIVMVLVTLFLLIL